MEHASYDMAALLYFFGCRYDDILTCRKVSQRPPDLYSGSPLIGDLRKHDKQVNVAPLGGRAPCQRTEEDNAQRSKASYDAVDHG